MTAKRESGLRHRIALALKARGCVVVTQHGGAYGAAGTSDLLVCVPPRGRFLALEVKLDTETTPGQDYFLARVGWAGGKAAVVRSVREALEVMAEADTELDDLFADLGLDASAPAVEDNDAGAEIVPDGGTRDEVIITAGAVEGEGLDDLFSANGSSTSEQAVADTVIEGVKAARGKGKKSPPTPTAVRDLTGTVYPIVDADLSRQVAALDQKFDRIMATLAQVLESTAKIIESARAAGAGDDPAS